MQLLDPRRLSAILLLLTLPCVHAHAADEAAARLPGSALTVADAAKTATLIVRAVLVTPGKTHPSAGGVADYSAAKINVQESLQGQAPADLEIDYRVVTAQSHETAPALNTPYYLFIEKQAPQQYRCLKISPVNDETTAAIRKATSAPPAPPKTLTQTATDQAVTLTLSCPATLWSGDANPITLTVRNNSNDAMDYEYFGELSAATFDVTRSNRAVEKTAWGRVMLEPRIVSSEPLHAVLKKGETLTINLNFTRYFDLSIPGKYEIQARWAGTLAGAAKPLALKTPPLICNVEVNPDSP